MDPFLAILLDGMQKAATAICVASAYQLVESKSAEIAIAMQVEAADRRYRFQCNMMGLRC